MQKKEEEYEVALIDYPICFFRKGIFGFERGKSHFVDLNKGRASSNRRAFVSLFRYCSNPLNPFGMGLFINHFTMGIKTVTKQPS